MGESRQDWLMEQALASAMLIQVSEIITKALTARQIAPATTATTNRASHPVTLAGRRPP